MPPGAMYDGADTVVLHDELAIEDDLPFLWRPGSLPLAAAIQNRYTETNARQLQVCLALDDQASTEKSDEQNPQAVDLARLEMKTNLLLDLVGRLLLQNHPRPIPALLRFNARGASFQIENMGSAERNQESGLPKLGTTGVFEIYLHDCLIDPLRLTGHIGGFDAGRVEVQFERPSDPIANLIDKLVFRRHRRQVAGVRKPRGG